MKSSLITAGCVVLLVLLLPLKTHSQDWERIAPKPVPKKAPMMEIPKELPTPRVEEDVVILDRLSGIRFVTLKEEISSDPKKLGQYFIEAPNFPLLQTEKFVKYMHNYFENPLTVNNLNKLVQDVVSYFRDHDLPVVYVVVPEQKIVNAVLQVLVIEGRIGEVIPEGNEWFTDRVLLERISLEPNDRIKSSQMRSDLEWVNVNPFREVNFVLRPGKDIGKTDLLLRTKDRWPVRFYGGFEDTGFDLTHDERWLLGVNWGDVFWTDAQANFQFMTDREWELYYAWSGSIVVQLPWRHLLQVFGSYSDVTGDIEEPIKQTGFAWQLSTRYTVPLGWIKEYRHETYLGWDLKQSNNTLEFGGFDALDSLTDVVQWLGGYNGTLRDPLGVTSAGIELVWSPGGITPHNTSYNFVEIRELAEADYFYGKVFVNRLTRLPWDFTISSRFEYQFSDTNLLPSEQYGLGGYTTVRGYDEREANGDNGWLLSQELRTPPLSLFQLIDETAFDELQFLGFWDYGSVYNEKLLIGEQAHVEFMSIGTGVRYQVAPYLTFRFDYGWHLRHGIAHRHNHRMHIGFVVGN
ncbi:ShlB/FhaC/HecB family hemolysin secretion/activation protein [Bdellovibrionota bacterium]